MATLVETNVAHFRSEPASGNPDRYEWQITDGWNVFDIQAAPGPDFYVPHWGMDREFVVQARALREEETGPWSIASDSVIIVPVPEPGGALLITGLIVLMFLTKLNRRKYHGHK